MADTPWLAHASLSATPAPTPTEAAATLMLPSAPHAGQQLRECTVGSPRCGHRGRGRGSEAPGARGPARHLRLSHNTNFRAARPRTLSHLPSPIRTDLLLDKLRKNMSMLWVNGTAVRYFSSVPPIMKCCLSHRHCQRHLEKSTHVRIEQFFHYKEEKRNHLRFPTP